MLDYESLRKRFTEALNSYSKGDLLDWKEKDEQQSKTSKMYRVINKGGYPAGTDVINPEAIFKTEDQAKNYVEHLVQLGYDENDFTIAQENIYNEDELGHIAVNYAINSLKGYEGTFTDWFNVVSKDWRMIANRKP